MAALCTVAALSAAPAEAQEFIYWANQNGGSIGRANLDGTGADQAFIPTPNRPACGIAVDEAFLYWGRIQPPSPPGQDASIGRAKLDGTGVDQNLLGEHPPNYPCGVAVNDRYLYWTNSRGTSIGRSNLDGSGVDQFFIDSGLPPDDRNAPCGVAVDDRYIYWANPYFYESIGRARLDGSSVNQNFITGADQPCGVAVDGKHVYWANKGASAIGRARLDGSSVNQSFVTGGNSPCGVAVDEEFIYWANEGGTDGIGRARLAGSGVETSFIPGPGPLGLGPCGVALSLDRRVDATVKAASPQRQGGRTLVVKIRVRGSEQVEAVAKGRAKAGKSKAKLGSERFVVQPGEKKTRKLKGGSRKAQRIVKALKRGKKATAKLQVRLTDLAGNKDVEKLKVTLKR